jgi:release factor glutamine methyltransferase
MPASATPQTALLWVQATRLRYQQANLPAEEVTAECRTMLAQCLGVPYAQTQPLPHGVLTPAQRAQLDAWVTQRLTQRMPLAYVLGQAWFLGKPFAVNPAVLIPRPETEVLVDWAINWLKQQSPCVGGTAPHILDVGTGSGCIAVTLASITPKAPIVSALDCCPNALAVAQHNAQTHGVNITWFLQDGLEAHPSNARYALIISNPPYIPEGTVLQPEVQKHEPAKALFSGPEGLDLVARLLCTAPQHLVPGGWLALELAQGQWPRVQQLAVDFGWHVHPPLHDLENNPRFFIAQWFSKV